MLRTDQYLEIESKWRQYKRNQFFKFISVIILTAIIIALSIAVFNNFSSRKNSLVSQNSTTNKTETTNLSTDNSLAVTQSSTNVSNYETVDSQNKKDDYIHDVTTKSDIIEQTNENRKTETPKKPSETKTTDTTKKEINSDIKPAESQNVMRNNSTLVSPTRSNNVLIETKEINNIDSLINRFNATRNVILAVMVAEEFYEQKDYANSLKWALTANEIDSKNEKSWIMFAKSKAKQGKSDEAIHALQVFIQHFPNSNSAKSLLDSLMNGSFK